MVRTVLLVAMLASAAAQPPPSNMNGAYTIANPNPKSGVTFSTDYSKKNAEYFDVYSEPISTVYSEVYWTMQDPIPLPADIVSRFDGKVMAVIGYEADQVQRTANGDVSWPICYSYNHHYEAYLMGSNSKMVYVENDFDNTQYNHGSPNYWKVVTTGQSASGAAPPSQFFSEGNGGEYRKSFHGYPAGMAQLIESPTTFHLQPMQIDTHNRDYNGTGFKVWTLPKEAQGPADPVYSPILECPCTTRITKEWSTVYGTVSTGTCGTPVLNATECWAAISSLNHKTISNDVVADSNTPSGCYMVMHQNGSVSGVFNTKSNPTTCGGSTRFSGTTAALVDLSLLLDEEAQAGGLATITISGPNGVWFGVGWNATVMTDYPYAIVVDGSGNVTEHKLGDHDGGSQLTPTQVQVVSNTVSANGTRTVVLQRGFQGLTPDYYTFSIAETDIPFINAIGSTPTFSYHKARGSATLTLSAVDAATCVCNDGIQGTINGLQFAKNCPPEPTSDLLEQHNPTCFIQTYVGGLFCCHHEQLLLDADQPVDNRTDTIYMKFRFWFQEYTPANATAPASHTNLNRLYFQTEAFAGEYDIVQCDPDSPPEDCVQTITAHWQVKQMIDCSPAYNVNCTGSGLGVHLIYAGGHCHAPSCISMELYNADTGDLLCRQVPVFGNGTEIFNEDGYLAIPPCVWGPASEGLVPPILLPMNGNLTSIKQNNNTWGHYGEMASWQMRGYAL